MDSGRRGLLAGGASAAALWLSGVGAASAAAVVDIPAFSPFRQAIAEAASDDEVLAAFYRETNYKGIWTGQGDRAAQRRAALFQVLADAGAHGLPVAATIVAALETQMRTHPVGARPRRDRGGDEPAVPALCHRRADRDARCRRRSMPGWC